MMCSCSPANLLYFAIPSRSSGAGSTPPSRIRSGTSFTITLRLANGNVS